jgi:hypothetical protein
MDQMPGFYDSAMDNWRTKMGEVNNKRECLKKLMATTGFKTNWG